MPGSKMYIVGRINDERLEIIQPDGKPLTTRYHIEALRTANSLNDGMDPQEPLWEVYQVIRIPVPKRYHGRLDKEDIRFRRD